MENFYVKFYQIFRSTESKGSKLLSLLSLKVSILDLHLPVYSGSENASCHYCNRFSMGVNIFLNQRVEKIDYAMFSVTTFFKLVV